MTATVVSGQTAVNYGALLDATKSYYVEITDGIPNGQYEGERFEVDVALTKSANSGVICINTGSSRNTIAGSIPADLAGGAPTFVIRPHVTISQVFGVGATATLTGTGSSGTADQIIFFENGTFSKIVWYFKSGVNDFWRSGVSNFNDEPILPGTGILIKRSSPTPLTVSMTGNVRTNHFAQPLKQGWNFICEPRPVDCSPVQRAMLDTDAQGNWVGTGSQGTADQLVKFASGAFSDITWYYKSGSNNSWRNGATLVNNDTSVLSGTGAVLLLKRNSAPSYYIPNTNPTL